MLNRNTKNKPSATDLRSLDQTAREHIPAGLIVYSVIAAQLQRDIRQVGQAPPAYKGVHGMRDRPISDKNFAWLEADEPPNEASSDTSPNLSIQRKQQDNLSRLSEEEKALLEIEGMALLEEFEQNSQDD